MNYEDIKLLCRNVEEITNYLNMCDEKLSDSVNIFFKYMNKDKKKNKDKDVNEMIRDAPPDLHGKTLSATLYCMRQFQHMEDNLNNIKSLIEDVYIKNHS